MIKALRQMFAPKTPALKAMDPQVAAAALMVEAALIDGVYVNIESDMIAEILLEAFGFDADKADASAPDAVIIDQRDPDEDGSGAGRL